MFKRMHVVIAVDGDTFEIEMPTKDATTIRRFARQMKITTAEYLSLVVKSEWHTAIDNTRDEQRAPKRP